MRTSIGLLALVFPGFPIPRITGRNGENEGEQGGHKYFFDPVRGAVQNECQTHAEPTTKTPE